jgi:hypothetical protein
VGRIDAGGHLTLDYRTRVGANAREGEQFNTASAAGTLSNGERVSTPRARASVRVRRGLFSSQQVILGRVYSDANLNGQFDKDERGVPGVRLYLNNGQSVITDSEGLYNFPVVNEGAQVLSLDPVTLPPGYALVETGRRDEHSWTRLLRTLPELCVKKQSRPERTLELEDAALRLTLQLDGGEAGRAAARGGHLRDDDRGDLRAGRPRRGARALAAAGRCRDRRRA